MGTVVAIVSDTHIGSWYGLSLPEWKIDTGEYDAQMQPLMKPIYATPAQLWLWEKWKDFWRHAKELSKGHRLIGIHLGDVIDGRHHQSASAMPNLEDQEAMAIEIMKNVSGICEKLIFTRGTEAHAGKMQDSEVRIAKEVGGKLVWEILMDIDGLIIDCAHHGQSGRRTWTSSASAQASGSVLDAVMSGRPIPRYVFRGHNHRIDDSGCKVKTTRAIAMPSFCMRNEFAYRVASGTMPDIGGVIILPNGELDLSMIRFYDAPGQRLVVKI